MVRKILVMVLLTFVLLITSLVSHPIPRDSRVMKHTRYGLWIAERNLYSARLILDYKDEIKLSGEQINKIENLQNIFLETQNKKDGDVKDWENKFKNYMKAKKITRKEIEKLIRKIARLKTDIQVDRLNHLLDLKEILTPQQIGKLDEVKKKIREKWWKDRKSSFRQKKDFRRKF